MARRWIAPVAAVLVVLAACGDGSDESDATDDAGSTTPAPATGDEATGTTGASAKGLSLDVAGIDEGGEIPVEITCDGANMAPVLTVTGVPDAAVELALIVDDPDAPTPEPFVHWALAGIPAGTDEITAEDPATVAGVNGTGDQGWTGPCPPPGDGPHTYRWRLWVLDATADVAPGFDRADLEAAIRGSVIGEATFTATYQRAG